MTWLGRCAALAIGVWLFGASLANAAPPSATVEAGLVTLAIEAPIELESYRARLLDWDADRLARFGELLGLDSSRPIPVRVILAPESAASELGAPRWVAGYAKGDSRVVVLFPGRVPVYPYRSLEELLGHEVAHLLVHEASGGRPLPRWFHEGLSMLAEEAWGLEDRSRVALALMRHGRIELTELEARFNDPANVRRAYALAGAFVRDLVGRNGRAFPADTLARVAAGDDFDAAVATVSGTTLDEAQDSFWRRFNLWYRWVPFLTSSTTLWFGVLLLAAIAVRRRRRRTRALEEQWMLEEAWARERHRPLELEDSETGDSEPVN